MVQSALLSQAAETERAEARVAELEGAIEINKVGAKNLRSRAVRAEAERDALRELLEMLQSAQWLKPAQRKAIRAALPPSSAGREGCHEMTSIGDKEPDADSAGPDGKSLAVLYCMDRAEEDVKLLREALEGMIAVAEGRFDGNPHADIDALAKARAALAPSPTGREG